MKTLTVRVLQLSCFGFLVATIAALCCTTPSYADEECERFGVDAQVVPNQANKPTIELHYIEGPNCNDKYNLMWRHQSSAKWHQIEIKGQSSCIPNDHQCVYEANQFNPKTAYVFKIQSCRTRFLTTSKCSPWSADFDYPQEKP